MPASWFRQIWQPASAKNHIAVIHFKTVVKDKCSHLYKAYLKSCQNLFERAPPRRRLFCGWIRDFFVCFQFFRLSESFSTNIFQRERVGIWLPGVTGWNQAFLWEVFQSPSWWQPQKRVSFAGKRGWGWRYIQRLRQRRATRSRESVLRDWATMTPPPRRHAETEACQVLGGTWLVWQWRALPTRYGRKWVWDWIQNVHTGNDPDLWQKQENEFIKV